MGSGPEVQILRQGECRQILYTCMYTELVLNVRKSFLLPFKFKKDLKHDCVHKTLYKIKKKQTLWPGSEISHENVLMT